MHKVECSIATLEICSQRCCVQQIGLPNFDAWVGRPWAVREFPGSANQAANIISFADQARGKTATDVSGGPRYRNAFYVGLFNQLCTSDYFTVTLSFRHSTLSDSSLGSRFLDDQKTRKK